MAIYIVLTTLDWCYNQEQVPDHEIVGGAHAGEEAKEDRSPKQAR